MRDIRKGTCPLCEQTEIIEAPAIEYSGKFHRAISLAVAHGPENVGLFSSDRAADQPLGALWLYVCRACGYVQQFAAEPASIPIGEDFQTRLVLPGETGGRR